MMKKFIQDALLVISITATIILVIYKTAYCNDRFLKKGNYIMKHEYMEKHADRIKTLLLGHSHFEVGINPHVIGDSVFDLAMNARVIYYDVALLEKYLPQMINLKTVIYPMHYSFQNACQFYNNKRVQEELILYNKAIMDLGIPFDQRLTYYKNFLKIFNYKTFEYTPITADSMGYCGLDGQDMANLEWLYKLWTNQILREDFTESLNKMAYLCEQYNVRFIVVTCPNMDTVLTYTTSQGVQAMFDVINEVKQNHPIEYRNYLDDEQFRADSLYQDESHLNHRGATLFAQRVKEDFGL